MTIKNVLRKKPPPPVSVRSLVSGIRREIVREYTVFSSLLSRYHRPLRIGLFVVFVLLYIETVLQGVSYIRYLVEKAKSNTELSHVLNRNWFFSDPKNAWWYREVGTLSFEFHPVLTWIIKPVSSPHIHVRADHTRVTTGNSPDPDGAERIFFFGGSTTFGAYLSDEETIPSMLAQKLNSSGVKAVITNYGQIGYNNNQELLYLWLLLKEGKRPDTVIFYDGCNELFFYPHDTVNEDIINNQIGPIYLYGTSPTEVENRSLINKTVLLRLLSAIRHYVKLVDYPLSFIETLTKRTNTSAVSAPQKPVDYSEAIARNYRTNAALLAHLADTYGFRYFLFWQPLIYAKPQTPQEKIVTLPPPEDRRIWEKTTALLRTPAIDNFYDISDTFSSETRNVFFDICHVPAAGNAAVAARMFKLIVGQ